MVIFDIMVSHYNMTRWHEAGLAQHKGDLAAIQTAKQACKQRLLLQRPQQPAPVNQAHFSDQTASLHGSALDLASSTQPAAAAVPNQMPQAAYPTLPSNPQACSAPKEGQMGVTAAAASQLASQSVLPSVSPEQQQQPVIHPQQALSGVASSPWQQQPIPPFQPAVSGSAGSQGGVQQQPAAVQAKLTVRFDSQVPAAAEQAAAAASQQHHHGRHPAHHSAHAAGEKVHAGLQPEKSDEHQQWRSELEVKNTSLKVSCVCTVIECKQACARLGCCRAQALVKLMSAMLD